jgi:glycosyltransferase involved in cell wall biosynthesis
MKISIITAVFNRVNTVGESIDSVQNQKFVDFEHIIIDGVSTDGSLDEIRRRTTPRMRIFSEADDGIYDALNKGMRLSHGDIIGVVHSDDFLAHDLVLKRVSAAFDNLAIDAVYGDLVYVAAHNPNRVIRHWRAGTFLPENLTRGWMPPHPALFIRRRLLDTMGGYDTRFSISADYDAILRWFSMEDFRTTYIPEVLVKMRVGGESNRSLERIFLKSREDLLAVRGNHIGDIGTIALKNVRKINQFFVRPGKVNQ